MTNTGADMHTITLEKGLATFLNSLHGKNRSAATVRAYQTDISQFTDFSVVLFRSDFVLVSEKNRMKAHKNQCAWTMLYSPECLSGATSRGQAMAPEVQTPAQ